ncbi:TPA: hypothetical protein WGW93_000585 [Neisseria meningitidis]|uniref:Uncharacterized protein n=4 Tax=Neisseria meningitidis TaxID=487 RepID=X5FBS2_NEIME|nr:hypothetical protein NMA510612_2452 [Neisseria meningitidis]EFV63302.1 hypothetical protein NMH_1897 [Neisseria meningitidis H44/76]EGC65780.1 hypothetical protein NMBM01240013_2130 [Neisseria meningitidis M01-240013]EOC55151.1 hypothetical protein NM271_2183 [Neisseria meningitidis NM271]MBS0039427.1 hypothetical protein [Neisseria sp. Marseille-Q1983]CRY99399.1 FIG00847852: hypothetical protein [Neisseria meningitidis serogroup B]
MVNIRTPLCGTRHCIVICLFCQSLRGSDNHMPSEKMYPDGFADIIARYLNQLSSGICRLTET